ncbi:MAG: Transposase [uncultured bacterium]|nr:MAG: Transposase [uncultured bacterium]HCB29975.1 hypothetical protein [Acinetobacter lwoffii]
MSKISAYQLTDIDFIALSKTESNPRTRVRLLMLAQMAKGVSPQQVAEQFGFNPITIRKLRRTFQTQGINGLYDREGRGRHSPLSIEQKEQLKTEIVALQQQRGGGRVTAVNIAELIQQKFNVVYNPNSLYKLLKQIGMSWYQVALPTQKRTTLLKLNLKKNCQQTQRNPSCICRFSES